MASPFLTTAPTLLTSWDDGSATDPRLAELLARYGFRGTFFATSRPAETCAASDADLRAIVGLGHEIGNHGFSHRAFTALPDAEILEEARRGMLRAREFSHEGAPIVAPPNGRLDRRVLQTLGAAGYLVRPAPIVACRKPRAGTVEPTCQLYPHGRIRTCLHLMKRRALPESVIAIVWLTSRSVFERLERLLEILASRPAPLHVWGHSEEIDRLRCWDEVESLLALAQRRGYVGTTLSAYLGRTEAGYLQSLP